MSEIARDAIRSGIIRKEILIGETLRETALSEALQISKTPIREALKSLESEHIVVNKRNKGYKVFTMNQNELVEFCELRFSLEAQALRYCSQRNKEKLILSLNNTLNEMNNNVDLKDIEKYLSLDSIFHQTFFKVLNNKFLIDQYNKINSLIEAVRHYTSLTAEATKISLSYHKKIINEIENGNIEKAVNFLEEHIVNWAKRLNKIE